MLTPNAVARRVTFYIAPDGTVANVDEKIKIPTAAEDSLATLTRLAQASAAGAAAPAGRGPAGSDTARPLGLSKPVVTTERNQNFVGPASQIITMDRFVGDFALPDPVTGRTWALTTLQAGKKATVIVFMSTESPVSNAYTERLIRLAQQYKSQGVAFIGINSNNNESMSQVAAHSRNNNFGFPVFKDVNNRIADRFRATKTPEVFVLNARSVLVYHGGIDDAQNPGEVKQTHLQAALDAVLAGQPVPAKTTPVIGGDIQRAQR